MTPWTVACEAPLSIGFLRPELQSGLPFPSPGALPDPGTEPWPSALAGGLSTLSQQGRALEDIMLNETSQTERDNTVRYHPHMESETCTGPSLAVQWLGFHAPNAAGRGLTPGWGTKIPYAAWLSLKKKNKTTEYNKKERLTDAEKKLAVPVGGRAI